MDPTADEIADEPAAHPVKDPSAILGSLPPLPASRLPVDPVHTNDGPPGGPPGTQAAGMLELPEAEASRRGSEKLMKTPSFGQETPSGKSKDERRTSKGKQTAAQVLVRVAAHAKRGDEAFAKADWDVAVDAYTEALALNATEVGAWAGRGGAHLRKGALQEALADLNEALRLEEDNLFALRDRAEARFKTGDLEGAIEDFDKKLSRAPADGRALCGRGEARMKKGDREGAISDFKFAMRLSYPGAKEMFNSASAASTGGR